MTYTDTVSLKPGKRYFLREKALALLAALGKSLGKSEGWEAKMYCKPSYKKLLYDK